jgi:biotin-(acetyl-CoA carboxylase) ligase
MHAHPDSSLASTATSVVQSLSDFLASSPEHASLASTAPGGAISRESILAAFLGYFEAYAKMPPTDVLAVYEQYDMLLGRTVIVMPKKREDTASYYEAKAIAYAPEGYLIVERNGQREELVAEEVTIRPSS